MGRVSRSTPAFGGWAVPRGRRAQDGRQCAAASLKFLKGIRDEFPSGWIGQEMNLARRLPAVRTVTERGRGRLPARGTPPFTLSNHCSPGDDARVEFPGDSPVCFISSLPRELLLLGQSLFMPGVGRGALCDDGVELFDGLVAAVEVREYSTAREVRA